MYITLQQVNNYEEICKMLEKLLPLSNIQCTLPIQFLISIVEKIKELCNTTLPSKCHLAKQWLCCTVGHLGFQVKTVSNLF